MCDRSAGSVQSLGEQKKQKQKSVETPKMASLRQREDGGKKQKQKKPPGGCGGIKTPKLIKPCREV